VGAGSPVAQFWDLVDEYVQSWNWKGCSWQTGTHIRVHAPYMLECFWDGDGSEATQEEVGELIGRVYQKMEVIMLLTLVHPVAFWYICSIDG
jgi:hypothetical protein